MLLLAKSLKPFNSGDFSNGNAYPGMAENCRPCLCSSGLLEWNLEICVAIEGYFYVIQHEVFLIKHHFLYEEKNEFSKSL